MEKQTNQEQVHTLGEKDTKSLWSQYVMCAMRENTRTKKNLLEMNNWKIRLRLMRESSVKGTR